MLSEAVPGGDLTYGLFPSVGEARDFVENDFRFELGEKSQMSRPCSADATARLEADYRGGNAECCENEEGVFINWTYRDSAVAAQLYLNPGTSVEAAVEARAKVV